jgi:hypothetical protein
MLVKQGNLHRLGQFGNGSTSFAKIFCAREVGGCLSQRSYAGARARRNAGMTFVMVLHAYKSGTFRKAFARAPGMCRGLSLKPYARAWHKKRIVSARPQLPNPTLPPARALAQTQQPASRKIAWPDGPRTEKRVWHPAIGCAKHYSRLHDAVIRVCDDAGKVIEMHEHAGEFREW